jgi:hypothetical protein
VGLDVHSKRSVFVIEAADGRVVARGDIPTTPAGFRQLREQHELAAETPVALETGTVAFYAARELARVGLRPVVIDAHEVRVKAHRPRQKSDRRDAFELCEGLRRGHYRAIVHVPPARIGALRETLSRRRHFVAVRVAEVNAVKRLLRAAGLGHLSKRLGTDAAWAKLLAALATEPALRTYVAQHHALWRCGAGADRGPGGDARRSAGHARHGRCPATDRARGRPAHRADGRGRLLGRAAVPEREARRQLCGVGTVHRPVWSP